MPIDEKLDNTAVACLAFPPERAAHVPVMHGSNPIFPVDLSIVS